jgi:SAM-dependent methyltransferase
MTDVTSLQVDPSNAAAAAAWNGDDGEHWVTHADLYDRSVARYHGPLLDAAGIAEEHRVLDIGCGNGQTTRDAARLASRGDALGVDLSAQLVANARRLAHEQGITNATFLQADAQAHPFEVGSFDVAISRTGAMFFGDAGAAFGNIADALVPGGRLALLVWQSPVRNEWFTDFRAALLAGRPPPSPPAGAPGPFSLAEPERVRALLTGAGFVDVALDAMSEPMYFGATADDADRFVRSLGFTRWMLQDLDDRARAGALEALRRSIDAHETPEGVVYSSATWVITATRSVRTP